MAISEEGVSLLDQHSMQPLARYSYDNVVTFGGCQEDFMLVITSETDSTKKYHQSGSSQDSSGTTKLLFNAGKPQVKNIIKFPLEPGKKYVFFSDSANNSTHR